MTSELAEIVLDWFAVTSYALAAVLFVVGFVFSLRRVTWSGFWLSLAGLVPHTVALAVRWVRVGHLPFLGFYEVVSGLALVSVVALGLIVWRHRDLVQLGVVLMPLTFLMMGGAMLAPKAGLAVTPKLASWWLTIHVGFAKLTYAAFIVSFALALVYLFRDREGGGRLRDVLEKLPSQEVIDDLSFKFVGAGFIFLGVMIAAGAIWANEAWGRYWGWDPVETWSLVSWLVYAIYLHLRLTHGWRGRKAAWLAVAALPVVVFSLIGVPIAYNSIHGAYIRGY